MLRSALGEFRQKAHDVSSRCRDGEVSVVEARLVKCPAAAWQHHLSGRFVPTPKNSFVDAIPAERIEIRPIYPKKAKKKGL